MADQFLLFRAQSGSDPLGCLLHLFSRRKRNRAVCLCTHFDDIFAAQDARKTIPHCLDTTLDHLRFFECNRNPGATKFLNVLQGNTTQQTDLWYDAVKGFPFEGWAFAGKLRHNFFNLCRRIIKMAEENKIQDRNWIHVLGTNELETAVGLTALQRAINRHINPHLRISYDTSSPFRMLRWRNVFQTLRFDRKSMTLPATTIPDARILVGSEVRFPWPSPLGDRMTLGDINVRKGSNLASYRDVQGDHYVVHHNLAALCYAVATANRIFDSEAISGQHTIAVDMGAVVKSIEAVIKVGTMTELERHKLVFNRIRKVEAEDDAMDQDRQDI